MCRTLRPFVATAVIVVVAFGAGVVTSPVKAVGCPPASGPTTNISCGGFANLPCPGNLVCVDDPRDDCCPETGGADCPGVCAPRL